MSGRAGVRKLLRVFMGQRLRDDDGRRAQGSEQSEYEESIVRFAESLWGEVAETSGQSEFRQSVCEVARYGAIL